MVKICQLDLKSLINKFKSDIHKIVDSRDLDPIKIIVNHNAVNDIKSFLPQTAVINKLHSHYHDHSPDKPPHLLSPKHPNPKFINTTAVPANPRNHPDTNNSNSNIAYLPL